MPTKGDRYHHGDLRPALIDAAIGVIADRGVRGFSVAEASRRLGVTTAAPTGTSPTATNSSPRWRPAA